MRNKFADTLYEIGKHDDRICAIVADISPAGSMEKFRNEFPDRFINCGVAEQAMIGLAAGLALEGMRPFCYTIATFSIYRPFEMIRVDLCYQCLPVTVIGMGAGVIYSTLGSTHHTIEDISIASSLPNMQVLAPCDPLEMKEATTWCAKISQKPTYMRLGKVGEPNFTDKSVDEFQFGKLRYIKKGKDVAIITYGTTIKMCNEIKDALEKKKLSCSLISCHTIKPLDENGIRKMLETHKKVLCIEEHVKHGGLGEKIKLLAAEQNSKTHIDHYHLKDQFIHFYGSYESLLSKHGIDKIDILKKYD